MKVPNDVDCLVLSGGSYHILLPHASLHVCPFTGAQSCSQRSDENPERTLFDSPGVLVANKVDLHERRLITAEQGKELAKAESMEYFEASAVSLQFNRYGNLTTKGF